MNDNELRDIFRRNLLRNLGATPQSKVAKAINVSPQTFNTWCKGSAMPRMGKVQRLADYFGIEKSDLLEDKRPVTPLSDKQKEAVDLFVSLPGDQQDNLLALMRSLKS